MTFNGVPITILLADDDEEDREMTRDALTESRLANDIRFVADGEELTDYLFGRGAYGEPGSAPLPGLILLDLNMPKKDGREVLAEIKTDPVLRRIPVVILTTSQAEQDILKSYDLHANCYISKPVDLDAFVKVVRSIEGFWLAIVRLPAE